MNTSVCFINCSNRNGRTLKMIECLAAGIKLIPGTHTHCYNLSEMAFSPCKGCLECWSKKNSFCSLDDDFTKNIENIFNYNIIVFATPVWAGSGTFLFKLFIERMVSILSPQFVKVGKNYGHKKRPQFKTSAFYLVSNCALPGVHNFAPILAQMKSLEFLFDLSFKGAVLKHQSIELSFVSQDILNNFYKLVTQAGSELITGNENFSESCKKILSPLIPEENYVKLCNEMFNF